MNTVLIRHIMAGVLTGLVLLDSTSLAVANLVEWRLRDLVFDDGATATGFFVVNTARTSPGHTPVPFDFDIDISAASFSAFTYTPAVAQAIAGDDPNAFVTLFLPPSNLERRSLQMGFSKSLPPDGGVVPLIVHFSCTLPCIPTMENTPHGGGPSAISGEVLGTIVPEPKPQILLITGLAALVGFCAKRRMTTGKCNQMKRILRVSHQLADASSPLVEK